MMDPTVSTLVTALVTALFAGPAGGVAGVWLKGRSDVVLGRQKATTEELRIVQENLTRRTDSVESSNTAQLNIALKLYNSAIVRTSELEKKYDARTIELEALHSQSVKDREEMHGQIDRLIQQSAAHQRELAAMGAERDQLWADLEEAKIRISELSAQLEAAGIQPAPVRRNDKGQFTATPHPIQSNEEMK
jgi:chromosome segregation ATPase